MCLWAYILALFCIMLLCYVLFYTKMWYFTCNNASVYTHRLWILLPISTSICIMLCCSVLSYNAVSCSLLFFLVLSAYTMQIHIPLMYSVFTCWHKYLHCNVLSYTVLRYVMLWYAMLSYLSAYNADVYTSKLFTWLINKFHNLV